MDSQPVGTRQYYGTTGILRPGAELPTEARVTDDPAEALAQAWLAATQGCGTPFVYEVGVVTSGALAVIVDVPVDAGLARRALEIAER